ncbi:MAG TPA: twin-arginine translocase TatA/TatE family subunit [Oligoflexus sp.]|uniref:Sec-independent protein translocase subunit TatA/TatB n=1 Tax=Oligoflexus sp. TaxID=1971216 RepID=UPI002D802337|nr:twin-arginine translocase TatA/TatE family subunit [Oligoflexus sp.]HET9237064.1 twin-arginine translocase TatA/TatE family subunit [Oligoflexus sp.]
MNLGMPELLIIGFVVVLLFGTSKLPKLGSSLGEAIRNFKDSVSVAEREEREIQRPQDKDHP